MGGAGADSDMRTQTATEQWVVRTRAQTHAGAGTKRWMLLDMARFHDQKDSYIKFAIPRPV